MDKKRLSLPAIDAHQKLYQNSQNQAFESVPQS